MPALQSAEDVDDKEFLAMWGGGRGQSKFVDDGEISDSESEADLPEANLEKEKDAKEENLPAWSPDMLEKEKVQKEADEGGR